jgi:H+/Cl- antiporter ClcA
MSGLVAVPACDHTLLLAFFGAMAFLAAVTTSLRVTIWAIAIEMTHGTAILALDVGQIGRLGTLLKK